VIAVVKKILVTLLISIAVCTGLAQTAYSEQLCKVVSPKRFAKLHSFPVKVVVKFAQEAQRETFRALLNGRDITRRFEDIHNGVQTLIGPEDGLRIEVRKDSRHEANILRIRVQGFEEGEEAVFDTFFFLRVDKLVTIGPKGGAIQSLDGNLRVDIPEDAVSYATSLAITKVRGTGQIGPAFQLSPKRIHFNQRVTVTMKYDPDRLPKGLVEDDLFLILGNEFLSKLENALVDQAVHTVSGTTTFFSEVFMSHYVKIGKKLTDIPWAIGFRHPIGDHSDASYTCGEDYKPPSTDDLGETLTLLHRSSYPSSDEPKILFNENEPAVSWQVTTAFDRNRFTVEASGSAQDRPSRHEERIFSNGEDWHFVGYQNNQKRLPIHAIADGLVIYNGRSPGNTVVLAHNIPSGPVLSVYSYKGEKSPCAVGTVVRKGNVIGKMARSGTDDSHLHFEIGRESLVRVDAETGEIKVPATWFGHWTQDSVYKNYHDPTDFLLNITGKHKWGFNINGNDEGWIAKNVRRYENGYLYRVKDGVLSVRPSSRHVQIVSYPLKLETESFDSVFVTMRSSAPVGHAKVYFATDEEPEYSEDKAVERELFGDGKLHEYRVFMGDNHKWKGTIVGVRIDLPDAAIGETTSIDFDQIRLGRAYLSRTPDTGQSKCYDNAQTITCPAPDDPFYGQDANYSITPPSYEVKTIEGHEVVIDHITGLTWQRNDDGVKRTWSEAMDYCEDLCIAGHSDWRLPTKKELHSITHHGGFAPAMDTSYFPFPHAPDDCYWSATTRAFLALSAWNMCLWNSEPTMRVKRDRYYVRAVRGRPLEFGHFRDNGDGTITDTTSGLMWQQTETKAMTWEKALTYCENLDLAGYRDWRLPNIRELVSLVDDSRYEPSVDIAYFSGCRPSPYWSSTTHALYPTFAWYVGFSDGRVHGGGEKGRRHYVRAVRGAASPDLEKEDR
jgi:murein DD-endopeptidase MepM/ murein hydrolase activator NlpD